jgi:hypothetical protein
MKPQMWLSDRLAAQLGHAEEHQFYLAHLIRDAQYAIDHGDTIFAPDFKALLKDACEVGRRRPDLADATIAAHRRRLEGNWNGCLKGNWSGCSLASQPMPRAASCETRCMSTAEKCGARRKKRASDQKRPGGSAGG